MRVHGNEAPSCTHWFKPSYPTVKKGIVPGLKSVPLEEYERVTGKRVDEFQRIPGGNVEYVLEGNGTIRFLRVLESDARYQPGGENRDH